MRLSRALTILLVTAFVATGGCGFGCGASKDEVLQTGREVEKELPLGSTEAQVEKFLNDRHLVHGAPYKVTDDPASRYRNLRQVGGTIENSWHSEPAIWISFYLDANGKLVESTIMNACGLGCYAIRPNRVSELRDKCD